MKAEGWIAQLGLEPHPEGGWFRETYRARETIAAAALPERYAGPRTFSTAIYYLLASGQCSHFHRVRSDEVWHFHAGSPLTIHLLQADGELKRLTLGLDGEVGAMPQQVVPANHWFAATVNGEDAYTLVGCTVAPGFDFADFELGDRDTLCQQWPRHRELIQRLTKGSGA